MPAAWVVFRASPEVAYGIVAARGVGVHRDAARCATATVLRLARSQGSSPVLNERSGDPEWACRLLGASGRDGEESGAMATRIATGFGIALLYAGAGCASATALRPLPPEKEAEINEIVTGRLAEVTIAGQPRTLSKDVRLDGNSVRFRAIDPASPGGESWLPETEKPLASLREIEVRDHGLGFFYGLGAGAGIGTVLGAIALSGLKSSSDECYRCELAVPVVGGAALAIGLLGAALGAAAGAPRTIEFKDAPSR